MFTRMTVPSRKPAEKILRNSKGKQFAVVLPLVKYRRLLEDLHDLAVVAERRRERTLTLTELRKRLKSDARL
jgi:hypothetical protein